MKPCTDKFWDIWDIFSQFISTHFGTVSPLSMFSINQPLFLQKLSLYIQISNDLSLGRNELGIKPSCVRSPCSKLYDYYLFLFFVMK